jgi:splicing factor 3B subunit 4
MNGQYLMNKEISVQYAYKKDGKGERHGDQAERMLADQARKHNVQPQAQPLPPQLVGSATPIVPTGMVNGDTTRPVSGPPPPDFSAGKGPVPMPPPQQHRPPPPAQPLAAPPPGLPARPPPSQAGYGGPQGFIPPGFNNAGQQANFPQGAPPPGFGPPAGFGTTMGSGVPPPPLPPGFQQPGYGRAR